MSDYNLFEGHARLKIKIKQCKVYKLYYGRTNTYLNTNNGKKWKEIFYLGYTLK